jgi:two-component system, LytTR family, sensor kinase
LARFHHIHSAFLLVCSTIAFEMKWITYSNKTQANLLRLEFWGFVTLFAFGVIFFIWNRFSNNTPADAPFKAGFDKMRMPFNYYKNYVIPVFIEFFIFTFGAFGVINFYIVPRLVKKEQVVKNVLLLLGVFLLLGLADAITDTYTHAYWYVEGSGRNTTDLVIKSFLSPIRVFVLFGMYTLLKYTGLYFVTNSKAAQSHYQFVQRDAVNAFVVWLITMFILIIIEADSEIILGWGIIAPLGILLYSYSFYSLIPRSLKKQKALLRYVIKVTLILILFSFPVFLLAVLSSDSEETASGIAAFNFAFQLLVTTPLSWLLYKRYLQGNEEIHVLQTELGKSNANLDFLRSQINPHFLFNAMNTLYGTAIQEGAERTSEGIQKLSDMMRFMLQENTQEKISLSREIEYLNNYISLQQLRTDTTPGIQIQIEIPETETVLQIAPMLLIPFVENAFKHGISFREPSHIKIALEIKGNTLYFDVNNSRHARPENDPEKDKSGIGLENVKQRLQFLYPEKHELFIRETAKEFFVHLVLQLK